MLLFLELLLRSGIIGKGWYFYLIRRVLLVTLKKYFLPQLYFFVVIIYLFFLQRILNKFRWNIPSCHSDSWIDQLFHRLTSMPSCTAYCFLNLLCLSMDWKWRYICFYSMCTCPILFTISGCYWVMNLLSQGSQRTDFGMRTVSRCLGVTDRGVVGGHLNILRDVMIQGW